MNIALTAKKAAGYLTLILAALTLAGMATPTAQASSWEAQQTVVASDGTSRVLWTATTPQGRVATVWRMDANGAKIGSGPVYGPYSNASGGWFPLQLAVASNGTCRLFWLTYNAKAGTSQADVWTLDANGTATSNGVVYGPYSDANGFWHAQQLVVAPDGSSRLLWLHTNTDNTAVQATVWSLDSSGNQTSGGGVYGPYYGSNGANWRPYELLVAPDGTGRLLWVVEGDNDENSGNYTGDTVTVWKLDTGGNKTGSGPNYGPYPGWGVAGLDINTANTTLRMLWHNFGTYDDNSNYSGDVACLWSLDGNGTQTAVGPSYGRYAGWSVSGVAALSDGTSRVEWDKTVGSDDVVNLWAFDGSDTKSFAGPVYGPFSGWTLSGIDIDRTDNSFRLLWNNTTNAAVVWSANSSGTQTSGGTVYGPYTF